MNRMKFLTGHRLFRQVGGHRLCADAPVEAHVFASAAPDLIRPCYLA